MALVRRLRCRLLGHHDWQPLEELRYEQATALAYVGDNPEPQRVPVTWVCDEVCAGCGAETWWPS